MTTNTTLKEHGLPQDAELEIKWSERAANFDYAPKFVVADKATGKQIATGFNSISQASKWARSKGMTAKAALK